MRVLMYNTCVFFYMMKGEKTMVCLKNKSFLKLLDFTAEEIEYYLDLAAELKEKKKNGIPHKLCEGKNVALIFEKTSTRTRCSFEVAAADLGMHPVYLDPKGSQIGKKESIPDTARVLGRMFDGIEYRGYGQEIVESLAEYAGVPVFNGLTNEFHPTQILADFLNKLSAYCTIQYYHIGSANHGQIRPLGSKASELASEDMEKIICNYIKDSLSCNDRVDVIFDIDKEYLEFESPLPEYFTEVLDKIKNI